MSRRSMTEEAKKAAQTKQTRREKFYEVLNKSRFETTSDSYHFYRGLKPIDRELCGLLCVQAFADSGVSPGELMDELEQLKTGSVSVPDGD